MSDKISVTKGGVFALGNFDGVHCGHRQVIAATMDAARLLNVPANILTFEPHPRSVFVPDASPFRLTPFDIKEKLLKACGIDEVIALPFTLDFAQMTAQDFVDDILLKHYGAQHIVAGHDFTFGHNRAGTMHKLAEWLAPHNIPVTAIAPVGDGEAFSSTRIRAFLQQGDVASATAMLGHAWVIEGEIVKGMQRGRTIGVPTTNISLGNFLRPKFGVYAVQAGRVGEALTLRGVANIGTRPTVDGVGENLEAHLFDFDQDIYGQKWQFALKRFIRPESKFETIDALKIQIARDIEAARRD